jgi:hypothetical protein
VVCASSLRNHKKRHRCEENSAIKRWILEDEDGGPNAVREELDSHADTGSFGDESKFHNDTGARVQVDAFKEGSGVMDVKVGGNAVSHDHPDTGWTFVLNHSQTLLKIDGLPSHLINLMQLRCLGATESPDLSPSSEEAGG